MARKDIYLVVKMNQHPLDKTLTYYRIQTYGTDFYAYAESATTALNYVLQQIHTGNTHVYLMKNKTYVTHEGYVAYYYEVDCDCEEDWK